MPILDTAFDLPEGRILALDLGQVRIGVAVSDPTGLLARPLAVVRRASREADFQALAALIETEGAVGVLIGVPLDSQGLIGPQARWARRYSFRLARSLPVPVAFWDESYSTVDAAELLRETRGRVPIDAAAAAVILTGFLEARRHNPRRSDEEEA